MRLPVLRVCLTLSAFSLMLQPMAAFAQAQPSAEAAKADFLLYQGLDANRLQIQEAAKPLDYAIRVHLYEKHRQQITGWYAAANFVSPIALGSIVQGDFDSAWNISIGKVGAGVLGVLGLALVPRASSSSSFSDNSWQMFVAAPLMIAALGVGIWSMIASINQPFNYAAAYDQKLIETLGLNQTQTLSWGASSDGLALKWSF